MMILFFQDAREIPFRPKVDRLTMLHTLHYQSHMASNSEGCAIRRATATTQFDQDISQPYNLSEYRYCLSA
jgi:hypothetical protein